MASFVFLLTLAVFSLVFATVVGLVLQYSAWELELGPIPRMFLGMGFNTVLVISIVAKFRLLAAFIPLMVIYYVGTYQIGMPLGHMAGFKAPDDNDPPDVFWELVNRY